MELLIVSALVIGVWLVLNHLRRQQFLRDYMDLQRKALEKGVALPGELKEIATARMDWAAVSLRIGIISLILGVTGVIIGMVILPNQRWITLDSDVTAVSATFWAFGLLLAAFGVGNLFCWFLIDKKHGGKTKKVE